HDQEEAYAIADRLVVMRRGRIFRDGPAVEVWSDPGTVFSARFLGHRNIVDRQQLRALGLGRVLPDADQVSIREAAMSLTELAPQRPPGPADLDSPINRAEVASVRFRGSISLVELHLDATVLFIHTSRPPAVGTTVELRIDPGELAPLEDGPGSTR